MQKKIETYNGKINLDFDNPIVYGVKKINDRKINEKIIPTLMYITGIKVKNKRNEQFNYEKDYSEKPIFIFEYPEKPTSDNIVSNKEIVFELKFDDKEYDKNIQINMDFNRNTFSYVFELDDKNIFMENDLSIELSIKMEIYREMKKEKELILS